MFHFRNYFSDILRSFSIVDVSLQSSVTHGLHARTSCETKTSEQLFLTTSWNYVNPAALHENLIAQVKINKLLLERGGRKEKKVHSSHPALSQKSLGDRPFGGTACVSTLQRSTCYLVFGRTSEPSACRGTTWWQDCNWARSVWGQDAITFMLFGCQKLLEMSKSWQTAGRRCMCAACHHSQKQRPSHTEVAEPCTFVPYPAAHSKIKMWKKSIPRSRAASSHMTWLHHGLNLSTRKSHGL